MAWLRLDDGFATHPKIAALTDRELRIWLRVLCYCSQHQDPTVDRITIQVVSGLTLKVIRKLIEVGLLDESGGDYEVHDWLVYAPKDPTGADRQAKWRARRNADRNGTSNGLRNGVERYADRDETVTSRAGARARPRPVPSPTRPETTPPSFPDLDQPAADTTKEGRTEDDQDDIKLPDVARLLKDIPA